MNDDIKRVTGLLIIEVVNSNPNGNPDQESDPRIRDNGQGEISPVSFKRKLRDLMELTEGPVFQTVTQKLPDVPDGYQFGILESRGRDRDKIRKEMEEGQPKKTKKDGKGTEEIDFQQSIFEKSAFVKNYWDARLFGNTFLEEGGLKVSSKPGSPNLAWGSPSRKSLSDGKPTQTSPVCREVRIRAWHLWPIVSCSMASMSCHFSSIPALPKNPAVSPVTWNC